MIITHQQLSLSAQQRYERQEQSQLRLETYQNGLLQTQKVETQTLTQTEFRSSSMSLSSGMDERLEKAHTLANSPTSRSDKVIANNDGQAEAPRRLQEAFNKAPMLRSEATSGESETWLPPHLIEMIEAIEAMMERLTGKTYHLKVYGYHPHDKNDSSEFSGFQDESRSFRSEWSQAGRGMAGDGFRVNVSHRLQEMETLRFHAEGTVKTADGRELAFDLTTQQSRAYSSNSYVAIQQGAVPQDPLVVNFGGQPAQLSLAKVELDLNNDGDSDQVAILQAGSGYLALDKNNDGKITEGHELFGTESGNGFVDLAAYDQDGNGWIDENDAVFADLQIYHQDSSGFMRLDGLMALNIGAISLASVASEFSHKDENNQLQAQVRSSGVFLFEDSGKAGSVQQIDLMI
ncbi:FG-GAP repeat domain-containing protein [Thiomicrorhabdus xiamenensis]|uniref:VCBS repeat-containing protein n=1 Tax=Thiomicrorhabdus xiamenensis TaxID=2739063 RepID=A0A7D4NNT4_9GAMM|nr:VCBS repeat-containing protein [Thiomicrorhabdus xiamenensis]QKI89013.1 VCBS repeat-containing protein [Thiomicrorhabdus xiamenensis]